MVSRCKTGIQAGANEDQDGCGQKDDSIVAAQTERARAAREHASAQGIDHVRQGIQMRNGLQPVLLANWDRADTVGVAHIPSIPPDRGVMHCSPPRCLFFEPRRHCSLRSSPSATNLPYCSAR